MIVIPRLTMQNMEDFQKDLDRKASANDNTPRPNSPDWDESGPLAYSPRHRAKTPSEQTQQYKV